MTKLPQLLANAKAEGWSDWIRSTADERAVLDGCKFDIRRGEHICKFFEKYLCHSKGQWAGKAFELQPWQRDDLFMPLFGWIDKDGNRRYRKAFVIVPKKNGKSTLASGVGLYLLCGSGEPGAEVYSAATDEDQAGIVHREAINMVDSSPHLTKALRINRSTKNIAHPGSKSFYRALTAKAGSKEGLNAHGIICDELHVWNGRELWDTLRYAGIARRQPLIFVITTAGEDMESVCRKEYERAKQILAGDVVDSSFFPLIYEAEITDDIDDPQVWQKANPSWGVTMQESSFRTELEEAKRSPTDLAVFKRYRLNVWRTATNPWLRIDDWQDCQLEYSEADLYGLPCYAGLDLAKTQDTTSLQLIFPNYPEEGDYACLSWFWLPEDTANDRGQINPYLDWSTRGYLELTPGNVCDYAFIEKRIAELAKLFDVREIAYDPYNAEQTTQRIEEQTGIPRVAFPQTIANFAAPTSELERLILSQKFHHNSHPVMTWQAGNVSVKSDANGNKRPVKPKPNDSRKIDGIVAAIMGLARAMIATPKVESVYEKRGMLVL